MLVFASPGSRRVLHLWTRCYVSELTSLGLAQASGAALGQPSRECTTLSLSMHTHALRCARAHTHRHTPGAQEEPFPNDGRPLKLLCPSQRSLESSKCSHCYYYKRLHRHMETHLAKTQISWFLCCPGEQQGCLFCASSRITDHLEHWGRDNLCL